MRARPAMTRVGVGPLLLALLAARGARAQFVRESKIYDRVINERQEALKVQLQNHPDLEDVYFPRKYDIPTDFYRFDPPTDYVQNVIFDPCRGYGHDCCNDTFGAPEFQSFNLDPLDDDFGLETVLKDDGTVLANEASRRPSDEYYIDEECTGFFKPHARCVKARIGRRPFHMLPRCWNHNATIVANQNCRAPKDGSPIELCMEVGITQTAYIVECGGKFKTNPHCGTFLEIHRKNEREILASVRLRGQYTSGYRMTVISTTYKGNSSRVLCEGDHEMWWVQRTRYDFIVERRIPFRIISPRCDWDPVNNTFLEFATVANAVPIANLDPYAEERFLFTRTRTVGVAGAPGKGMGSTLVLANATEFPPKSRFEFGNPYTYTYTPEKPDLTVKSGQLWHP